MGNTKYYCLEGTWKETFDTAWLMKVFRADKVALAFGIERNYDTGEDDGVFIAAIESYSQVADHGVNELAKRCSHLFVVRHDLDWTDQWTQYYEDGVEIERHVYGLKS